MTALSCVELSLVQLSHKQHVKIFTWPKGTRCLTPWRTLTWACKQKWARPSAAWAHVAKTKHASWRQPSFPCLLYSHCWNFDYSAALKSMRTCCYLSDIALALRVANDLEAQWNWDTSKVHVAEAPTSQVCCSSPPHLLNASLSSAFSLRSCVASPLNPHCYPTTTLGPCSKEAPTLRTPTR